MWVLWNSGIGKKKTKNFSTLTCWFDPSVTCCLLQQSATAARVVFMETVAVGWATGAPVGQDGGRFVQVDFFVCRSI